MPVKEKRWRTFYLCLMIFFYVIYVPLNLVDWLMLDGKFPFVPVFVGIALPFMRKKHLEQIRIQH